MGGSRFLGCIFGAFVVLLSVHYLFGFTVISASFVALGLSLQTIEAAGRGPASLVGDRRGARWEGRLGGGEFEGV
jgi:hypothetical protein